MSDLSKVGSRRINDTNSVHPSKTALSQLSSEMYYCRSKAAKDAAASGYAKTKSAASDVADQATEAAASGYVKGKSAAGDAAEYASETATSVKDGAADAASSAYSFISSYLSWGQRKATENKDSAAKSIQVPPPTMYRRTLRSGRETNTRKAPAI
jgi:hypothetical protein